MGQGLPPLTLVLGGQRSGKSAYAEGLIGAEGVYIATGKAGDAEMAARIEAHQARRGTGWTTAEEPLDICTLLAHIDTAKPLLLDSVGMWVANLLEAGRKPEAEAEALAEALIRHPGPAVAVAEEVGLGVIPMNALARRFADALGHVNQALASRASRVVLVSAGLPLELKNESE